MLTNVSDPPQADAPDGKNKIAQALVALRHKKLSPERRSEIASKAATAKWKKWRKERGR